MPFGFVSIFLRDYMIGHVAVLARNRSGRLYLVHVWYVLVSIEPFHLGLVLRKV